MNHSGNSGEIVPDFDAGKTGGSEQVGYITGLPVTDLQEKMTAGDEQWKGFQGNPAVETEPVCSSVKRQLRLAQHLRLQDSAFG